ncbi:alpha/beta fold hydrolase [Actinosynnema sp. NPDC020468]|uniref:thioesterase II family protein n=1 Tax=Actinosynnema sp. NPDC020468 TaxID=3154488 RepID=UPI0034112FB5
MDVTLVCLPFAGAGASFFRPWKGYARGALDVRPLQLPGREELIDEEPFTDVPTATTALAADLRGALEPGARVALFGHSLGAVLAYELARRLTADLEVVGLFVSGSPEPHRGRERRATGLSDDEFLARVAEFAGYRHEALRDPEMREMVLPALRADVRMHEDYAPEGVEPLDVPITVLRGEDDELVSPADAAGWSAVAGAGVELVELPGGHMYLTDTGPALVRLIASTVL